MSEVPRNLHLVGSAPRRWIALGLALVGLTVCLSRPAAGQGSYEGQAEPSDTALANSLAAELAKAGVDLSAGDLTAMLQGITKGGEAGEALAQSISQALMKAMSDLEAVAAGQDPGPALDQGEIDELLRSLPASDGSTDQLARILREKLQELEKAQQQ